MIITTRLWDGIGKNILSTCWLKMELVDQSSEWVIKLFWHHSSERLMIYTYVQLQSLQYT